MEAILQCDHGWIITKAPPAGSVGDEIIISKANCDPIKILRYGRLFKLIDQYGDMVAEGRYANLNLGRARHYSTSPMFPLNGFTYRTFGACGIIVENGSGGWMAV